VVWSGVRPVSGFPKVSVPLVALTPGSTAAECAGLVAAKLNTANATAEGAYEANTFIELSLLVPFGPPVRAKAMPHVRGHTVDTCKSLKTRGYVMFS
jgi:hypothetical protein